MSTSDTWASGSAYEPYVGRWSRLVAKTFLEWLVVPANGAWLDVGCGTGALTQAIVQQAAPASVVGVDPAEGFIDWARRHMHDKRVSLKVGDAMALPFDDKTFDAAVSGLALNFMPDPQKALSEMARVTRHRGVVATYVWDYAGEMQMMRVFWDAAVELDEEAAEKDEGPRFPICNPEPLARLFKDAGLADVEVRAIDIPTHFSNFDDYWSPFLGGQGPAPGYVIALSDEHRIALMERVRSKLPIAEDGSISLMARAWAVCGTRWRTG